MIFASGVVSARADGRSCREVARLFNVSVSSVAGRSPRHKRTGSVRPGRMGRISRIGSRRLPGLDSGESPRLSADRGAAIADAACGARHSGGPRYGPARSAVSRLRLQEENARRGRWKRHQGRADPRKLVFIDETCVKTDMAPLRGWAPKGERLPGKAPGRWRTSTFIGALRHDRIDAPWVLDGPADGDAFRAYVETQLVPTLRRGDIAVMDTPGSHKTEAVRAAIRGAGAHLLFLPPCSPDPDPIEQAFAKLKHLLRKDQPRSRETLRRSVGDTLGKFKLRECANYLVNAGYAST